MFEHEYFEYLAAYALGALTPEEKARLEEHLRSGCDVCEPELLMLNETVTKYPQGAQLFQMPAGLKDKVRGRLEKEGMFTSPVIPVIEKRSQAPYWLATAALLAAALTTLLYWNTYRELKTESVKIAQKDAQISEMEESLRKKDAEISWLRDPGVQLALLTGLAEASHARGKIIWHPVEHKGIFYVESLPKIDPSKSYQLWVIGAHGPVSAGVFAPDTQGAAVVTISRIEGKVDGPPQFAVTVEPYGGVKQPTTTPILLGKPL
jgi:anti-sigma-K factor RskA